MLIVSEKTYWGRKVCYAFVVFQVFVITFYFDSIGYIYLFHVIYFATFNTNNCTSNPYCIFPNPFLNIIVVLRYNKGKSDTRNVEACRDAAWLVCVAWLRSCPSFWESWSSAGKTLSQGCPCRRPSRHLRTRRSHHRCPQPRSLRFRDTSSRAEIEARKNV